MSETEWDEPGYAVIISDQNAELGERMQGMFHVRSDGDPLTMTFVPFGDGKFQIDAPGVACRIRYCLASGDTLGDEPPFVLQPGAEIALSVRRPA